MISTANTLGHSLHLADRLYDRERPGIPTYLLKDIQRYTRAIACYRQDDISDVKKSCASPSMAADGVLDSDAAANILNVMATLNAKELFNLSPGLLDLLIDTVEPSLKPQMVSQILAKYKEIATAQQKQMLDATDGRHIVKNTGDTSFSLFFFGDATLIPLTRFKNFKERNPDLSDKEAAIEVATRDSEAHYVQHSRFFKDPAVQESFKGFINALTNNFQRLEAAILLNKEARKKAPARQYERQDDLYNPPKSANGAPEYRSNSPVIGKPGKMQFAI